MEGVEGMGGLYGEGEGVVIGKWGLAIGGEWRER